MNIKPLAVTPNVILFNFQHSALTWRARAHTHTYKVEAVLTPLYTEA